MVARLTKTTAMDLVYVETGVPPIRTTERIRAVWAWERLVRGRIGDPGREMTERRVERRLKANKGWREQARAVAESVCGLDRAEMRWVRQEPWTSVTGMGVEVYQELEEEVSREDGEEKRREAFLRTLEKRGQLESLVECVT